MLRNAASDDAIDFGSRRHYAAARRLFSASLRAAERTPITLPLCAMLHAI